MFHLHVVYPFHAVIRDVASFLGKTTQWVKYLMKTFYELIVLLLFLGVPLFLEKNLLLRWPFRFFSTTSIWVKPKEWPSIKFDGEPLGFLEVIFVEIRICFKSSLCPFILIIDQIFIWLQICRLEYVVFNWWFNSLLGEHWIKLLVKESCFHKFSLHCVKYLVAMIFRIIWEANAFYHTIFNYGRFFLFWSWLY